MELVEHHAALNRPVAPVCSVCIANYNGGAMLDDCLASVFAQQGNIIFEIVVHDDASTDDSIKLLREKYPQVEVLASCENVGFCIGNNRMVDHARGEFILLLNNDAALYPDALATLVATANAQTPTGILTLPQYDWDKGELVDRGCMLDPFLNPVPNKMEERGDVGMVMGACLWIPRALWMDMGGFPEWFGSIGEDLYLCCRTRLAGRPVQVTRSSGYRHRIGASFGGGKASANIKLATTFRRRALSERNKTFVMAMTYPAPAMQLWLPIHLALLLVEGLLLSLFRLEREYLFGIYLPAFRAVFGNFGRLRKERRDIVAQRSIGPLEFFSVFDPLPYKLRMLIRHGLPDVE